LVTASNRLNVSAAKVVLNNSRSGKTEQANRCVALQEAASQQLELDYYVTAHTYSKDGNSRANMIAE
jgi:hypothetical protein